jgi:hypothetical protein
MSWILDATWEPISDIDCWVLFVQTCLLEFLNNGVSYKKSNSSQDYLEFQVKEFLHTGRTTVYFLPQDSEA